MLDSMFMRNRLGTLAMPAILAAIFLAAPAQIWSQRPESSRGEDRIAREVRHELLMLPYHGVFDNLQYKVNGNEVTLMGQVSRPSLKKDAEAAVKHIEGVERVNNQIEVLPTSINDDQLRLAVYRAIYGQGALEKYAVQSVPSIHVIVKGGHVILEGVVNNEGDKNIAGIKAREVSGVFSVTNNLRVVKD